MIADRFQITLSVPNDLWEWLEIVQRPSYGGNMNDAIVAVLTAAMVEDDKSKRGMTGPDLADAMKDIDVLLTPSACGEAPAGLSSTGDTSFNNLSTWTYTPCVTLPVFTGPSGLPVGIQVIGHRNQDHRLLEGAQAVDRVFSKST